MENFISELINGLQLLDIYVVIFLLVFFGFFISLPLSLYINIKFLLEAKKVNYKYTFFLGTLGLMILLFIIGGTFVFYSDVLLSLTMRGQEIIESAIVLITLLLLTTHLLGLGHYIKSNLSNIDGNRKLIGYICSGASLIPFFTIIYFLIDKSYQDILYLFELWSFTSFVFVIYVIFLTITYSYLKED